MFEEDRRTHAPAEAVHHPSQHPLAALGPPSDPRDLGPHIRRPLRDRHGLAFLALLPRHVGIHHRNEIDVVAVDLLRILDTLRGKPRYRHVDRACGLIHDIAIRIDDPEFLESVERTPHVEPAWHPGIRRFDAPHLLPIPKLLAQSEIVHRTVRLHLVADVLEASKTSIHCSTSPSGPSFSSNFALLATAWRTGDALYSKAA